MGSTDKTEPVLMRRAAWGVTLFLVQICLVGGIPTPLKNMSSSVGDDEILNWMESHKIPWFQTTNQLFFEFFWGMTHRFTICFPGLLKGYSMFDIQHGRLVLRRRPHCHFDLLHFAWEKSRFFEWIPETLQKHDAGDLFKMPLIYPPPKNPLKKTCFLTCQNGKHDETLNILIVHPPRPRTNTKTYWGQVLLSGSQSNISGLHPNIPTLCIFIYIYISYTVHSYIYIYHMYKIIYWHILYISIVIFATMCMSAYKPVPVGMYSYVSPLAWTYMNIHNIL